MLYFSGHEQPLLEWEYLPPIGPRPHNGFVGLKNAGATCYMNSVLQQVTCHITLLHHVCALFIVLVCFSHVFFCLYFQLFMIKPFCNYLLSVDGAADDFSEDEIDKMELDVSYLIIFIHNELF